MATAIINNSTIDTAVVTAADVGTLDHTVKTWLEAGIPPLMPGPVFRRIIPMGTTHFYELIKNGRLRAVKHAGRACVEIEEAIRFKNQLPKMPAAAA
jgi:hypothetical protein